MQMQPLAEQFYLYLEAEKASSPLTIQAYRADMKSFLGFLEREHIAPQVESVTTPVLRNYLIDMTRRGLKASSRARRLHALRSFWRYLVNTDVVILNPLCKRRSESAAGAGRKVRHPVLLLVYSPTGLFSCFERAL